MPRSLSLLLFIVGVPAVLAAPAPFPRTTRPSVPWVTGWGKPEDPVGDCRFDRDGERLTITVPCKGHQLDLASHRLNAPRLLREVEGDFVAQVRIERDGRMASMEPGSDARLAGLVLAGGGTFKLKLTAGNMLLEQTDSSVFTTLPPSGPRVGNPVWLRLERRGNVLRLAYSADGKSWKYLAGPLRLGLPRQVKVGVVAETTGEGVFKVVFDQFRLWRLDR